MNKNNEVVITTWNLDNKTSDEILIDNYCENILKPKGVEIFKTINNENKK
jgi:hypothetical protein